MSASSRLVDPADAVHREHTDETLSVELIEHATALLSREQPDVQSLFQALCDSAPPQDIIRYTVPALATLTRLISAIAKQHKKGESIVRLIAPHEQEKDYVRMESVLVAVNDDMPFLFDSLLAEAATQRARLRAVFHPIISLNGNPTS